MSKDKGKGEFKGGAVGKGVTRSTKDGKPVDWKVEREDKSAEKGAQRHDKGTTAWRRVRGEGRSGNK